MANVEFRDVNKYYPDGYHAITDLTMSIDDGEFVILVGPSGCGKSTALRMVAGLEEITSGELLIGDQVVNDMTPKERDIAMVFQSYALYPHMTVAENMGFSLKLSKTPKDEIDKRVNEAADVLGLDELLHRKPKALSGGQRQRVAMGRAIVRQPKAFLMDEPLSNLDAKLRVQMRAEIAALQNRLGVTTIYVTHDQVEAMTMGDRVAVLKKGVLSQVDSPQALYENPDNLFVAGFIGSPAMNLGVVDVVEGSSSPVAIKIGGSTLDIPQAALEKYPGVTDRVGSDVAVGLRPEHFDRETGDGVSNRIDDLEVELVEMLGAEMLVHLKTDVPPVISEQMRAALDDDDAFEELERQAKAGGQTFVARFEPGAPPKLGSKISVGFRTDRAHFFDRESGLALR
ncbi:ABC transporter ATP-binding protein [Salsipaludibacter albus]|uniref:ABC transporter ATP-binding protein n=1 Tax=Salsipaludibacter albus TaxID=2849650 RepID=UPI001EE3A744|nr:sn-glycerol-3-phosphate ABC transporter ATP-binding protein UgpC [Salsipaludibacter albus]MBY5160910.1 sn-glycerol-3-phosphate ABC transporter ATP-binding protein UgpC [Salsipaludibacter albus]